MTPSTYYGLVRIGDEQCGWGDEWGIWMGWRIWIRVVMANMDDAGGYGIILKWRRVGLEMGKYYPFTNYGIERGQ